MIDFRRGEEVETRAVLERLLAWTEPARDAAWESRSTCRRTTAPSGRARRSAAGASIEDVYRDAVAETRRTYAGAEEPVERA